MKKILILILSFLIALLSLCGCNGQSEGEVGKLVIKIHQSGTGSGWAERLAAGFMEENEGVTVVIKEESGLTASLNTILQNNVNLADMYFVLESPLHTYAAKGWLEPLDDLFASEVENGITYQEKIDPSYLEYFRSTNASGTHFYGIPHTSGVSGIYYNSVLYEEKAYLGRDENGKAILPETVDDLFMLCSRVLQDPVNSDLLPNGDFNTANDIKPFVFSTTWLYWDFLIRTWVVQQVGIDAYNNFHKFENAEIFKEDTDVSKAKLKALKVFEDLIIKNPANYIAGSQSKGYIDAQLDFVQGRALMIPCGAWLENEMRSNAPEGFVAKAMPTPYIDGALKDNNGDYIRYNYTSAGAYGIIPKNATNKELAKKFALYVARDASLKEIFKENSIPHAIKIIDKQISGLTPTQASIWEIYNNSQNIFNASENPLYKFNKVKFWAVGVPYGSMITSGKTAEEVIASDYTYAKNQWAVWEYELGL